MKLTIMIEGEPEELEHFLRESVSANTLYLQVSSVTSTCLDSNYEHLNQPVPKRVFGLRVKDWRVERSE